MEKEKDQFMRCSLCNKTLIKKESADKFVFLFGKNPQAPDFIPVEIEIEIIGGSIKMRCIRKRCRREHPNHWNIIKL